MPTVLGAAATTVAAAVLEHRPPGGRRRWERTNFAGRTVSLLGGAAAGVGAVAGPVLAAAATAPPGAARAARAAHGGAGAARTSAAAVLAASAGAAMGLLDDLTEDATGAAKGLRGHLGALRQGHVTTGALKILGIGAGALAAAAVATPRRTSGTGRIVEILGGAALVAGTANLHNLFDLRPGRALKVATAVSGPLALTGPGTPHGTLAATALGVAGAALPDDLAERTMLGDTGANAVGALVGTALAAHPSRTLRAGALSAVVALTLLSERVSFSGVIERNGVLRRVDALGRRPR
ncbi:hypothetical protein FE374_06940 [Georgenia yuyongxinii]|uniref:UDP-N-acetylmuramyl pentapeptide phosphotransferase/UDP-N-acetylglucosamine-1-phosphate transferase n=1 Tax=Georgenia yuyongxinii TaxID=2589797 RepID=A0A5B8CAC2_9MICO|nr:hypothetical protein FE374_06940 [Georgenia yuyongxinii]